MSDYVRFKLSICTSLLSLAVGIYLTTEIGTLYPYLHAAVAIATLSLLYGIMSQQKVSSKKALLYLSGLVCISVLFRVYIFQFAAMYHGKDAGWFAVQASSIASTGHTSSITNPFYRVISLYIISIAEYAKILGVSIHSGTALYPIIMGASMPVFVWCIVRRVVSNQSFIYAVIAAALMVSATISVLHSIYPIAQTMSTVILLLAVLLIIYTVDEPIESSKPRWSLLFYPIVIALFFSHKTSLFVLAIAMFPLVCYLVIFERTYPPNIAGASLLVGLLLIVQWGYATNFISTGVIGLIFTEPSTSSPITTRMATQVGSSMLATLHRSASIALLYLCAGISWVYLAYNNFNLKTVALLSISAAAVVFSAIGIVMGSLAMLSRGALTAEPILVILVIASIDRAGLLRSQRGKRLIMATMFIFVIVQSGSLLAAPDAPNQPRRYLTEGELAGKKFEYKHRPGMSHMDSNYASRVVSADKQYSRYPKHFSDTMLLSGLWDGKKPSSVLYRTQVSVYSFRQGWYRLDWNPESRFDRTYSKTYTNGWANFYVENRSGA